MFKKLVLFGVLIVAHCAHSQIVGSRENSDATPGNVGPAQLSGGGFAGDVNVFNGSYGATYPLGAVSTPGGLGFTVSLNYSASYSVGQTPSVSSGIPYGEGWNVGIPTISVSNAAYFSFLATYECNKKSQTTKDEENYFDSAMVDINGMTKRAADMNGDVFWFSPHVSIPGVGSGRAVFKYIDEDDANCAVFVLNKFERYLELRYYGDSWRVKDDAGNQYDFRTTVVTYRAPNNSRILNYRGTDNDTDNDVDDIITNNSYGFHREDVLNTLEPKQSYTSWYCSAITNWNIPDQSIVFEYEKFGGFNYYKEFEQPLVAAKTAEKLRDELTLGPAYGYLDFTAYTDILLTKVTSRVSGTLFEVVDLGYATSNQIGSRMLDPNDEGVERLDSLYAYTTVYSEGIGSDEFEDWNRYYHVKSDDAVTLFGSEPSFHSRNPYQNSGGDFLRDEVTDAEHISFDHAFLESPRILTDGSTLVPGDIYEIKTTVADNNGSNTAMGTGTLDINVVTGDLGFALPYAYYADEEEPCDSLVSAPLNSGGSFSGLDTKDGAVYLESKYELTRGTKVFTTHNQAVKWHIPDGATSISTSNFFVMPNIPNSYDGVNLQIGPGNSDSEYNLTALSDIKTNEGGVYHPSAYNAYSHIEMTTQALRAFEDIPAYFGVGLPWSMTVPLYINQMGGMDDENAQYADAFNFWYNHPTPTPETWDNEPTKFNEQVVLKEVEVIRYSKTPYMLSTVKSYRVNGEISSYDDTSGLILVAQQDLEYGYETKRFFENYDYDITYNDPVTDTIVCYTNTPDTLIHSSVYDQAVYTLNRVKTIPVAAWENNPSVAASYADTSLLQTEFEYEWYGYEDDELLVFDEDGHPGRRTRVMSKYIDQLGGETHISYYPRDSKFTLKEGRYTGMQNCASYGSSIFGKNSAYDIHPAVQYLTKLDEKNNVESLIEGQPLKRWEYIYDTTQIIYQSFDYDLIANFRGGYKKSYSKGYAKTTVFDPELETGEQSYTEYYHHGNIYTPTVVGGELIPDTSTLEEYLYFGKPQRIARYNSLDEIEEETLFEYGYTKAFENGYARKRTSRDNLLSPVDFYATTNWVHAREYEYADYYKNETDSCTGIIGYYIVMSDDNSATSLSYTFADTTVFEMNQILAYTNLAKEVTSVAIPYYQVHIPKSRQKYVLLFGSVLGDSAKLAAVSNSYLSDKWGSPFEKAKFLETYLYDNLHDNNPDFLFHSYFLKTESKTTRSYDTYCRILPLEGAGVGIPVGETVAPNPFGTPYINPNDVDQMDSNYIAAINGSSDGTSIESALVSASPLSEAVLDALVGKIGTFNSGVIRNILVEQPALSDDLLNAVFNGLNYLAQSDAYDIFTDQPYLSDPFLISVVANSTQQQDQLVKEIFNHNAYLSDTVMIEMASSSGFSQNVLKDVLLNQGQMSEAVLLAVVTETNNNASFAIEAIALNQPILSDTIFYELAENANLSTNKVMSIYNGSQIYPSDYALISLMNRTPSVGTQNLVLLMQASDHVFEDSLETKIISDLGIEYADQIFEYHEGLNPYSSSCNNSELCASRGYLETVTEYDYYEAEYDGSTLAEGYKKLMGLEDVPGRIVLDSLSELGVDMTLSDIKLKHQPSWQLFRAKTYSPDYPGAYQSEEYYYYYDLLNRKNRHFQYYDLASDEFGFEVDTDYYNDTAIFHLAWPPDHLPEGTLFEHIPLHDGEKLVQRSNLRNIAFQKTTFSKNNAEESAIVRSEYYNYDARWNTPEFYKDTTVEYSGPTCGDSELYSPDCDDCFSIHWAGSEEDVLAQVPWGYCAYKVQGTVRCCPMEVNPEDCPEGYIISEFVGCQPNNEDPYEGEYGIAPVATLLDKILNFRSFVIQIDTIPAITTSWNGRTDKSNTYIMDFYLGIASDLDEVNRRRAYATYPFDTLTVRTVDERNRLMQVQLEHNASNIYTKYDYTIPVRTWHHNVNSGPSCYGYGNYSSIISEDIGMPTQITVGFGRDDSMSTQYAYYPNYSVDSIVNPSGHRLHYTFDDYDRLVNTYDNSRLLSSNDYAYWQRDTSLSFQARTSQNYVETNLYNNGTEVSEHIRAYVDPLGRNYSTITTVDHDSTQIHSGTLWYDNWGRVSRAFKPYKLSDQTSFLPTSDTTLAYAHNLYENTPKSRTLRTAKYGITDIMDTHTTKQSYKLINHIILACELDLKSPEAALLINPDFEGAFKFVRLETEDEDGKKMISYANAFGQQVATKQFGESETDELITLFAYDNYGNLTTVINPEEDWTHYEYNILGQLIKETTLDAGEVKYMYNKRGLLSVSQDENGRIGEVPPAESDTLPYFRVYEYDDYGRLLVQKRAYWTDPALLPVHNNPGINPLFYKDTSKNVDGAGGPIILDDGATPEAYFDYHFSNRSTYDWMAEMRYMTYYGGGGGSRDSITGLVTNFINLGGGAIEKQLAYGEDTTANRLGKVKQSFSYDAAGSNVERTTYTYNKEEQISEELVEFSATGEFADPSKSVKARLSYPAYNYRGSLEYMTVDIDDDGIMDFQYSYTYDDWNRLREIYVSYKAGEVGNRVVSYDYDDALGLLTTTKHYVNQSNGPCGEAGAQTVEYTYDVRDRLTEISSELFDYSLYYDNNLPSHADFTGAVAADQNWNGNINGTVADYKFDGYNIMNGTAANELFDSATVYGFKYDLVNRLYQADAHAGDLVKPAFTNSYGIGDVEYNYDRIGNITNLKRGLAMSGADLVNEEWDYSYYAGTNRLKKVKGLGVTTDRNYTYDANGNLASDDHRLLSDIRYARANYPFELSQNTTEISYLYSIGDQRIYKETRDVDTTREYYLKNIGILDLETNNWTWYVSGIDRVAKITPLPHQQPNAIDNSDTTLNDNIYSSFYLYDHLGNTRIVYTPTVQCPGYVLDSIDYVADYYPYGKVLRQYVSPTGIEKFLTTQHERDQETGLDYRGARFYDGDIARFLSLDPLAANYPSLSDYSYVAGNPVMFVDPTGMSTESSSSSSSVADLGGMLPKVTITYYQQYSKEFNALAEHQKNFLIHKWQVMEEGNIYKALLGQAIEQGSTEAYYKGFMDKSGWWDSGAQRNWEMGHKAWNPNGTGASMMRIATVSIGGTLAAVGGGSIIGSMAVPAIGSSGISISSSMTIGNGIRGFLGVRGSGALQSGGLNFFTQLYGNNWDIGAVDWTGVGSATLTGAYTGPGFKGLLFGSAAGAFGDAVFDLSYNDGFSTIVAPEGHRFYKDSETAARDFAFGFVGNFMGGASSVSGGLGALNRYSFAMEAYVDGIAINMNIGFNKRYSE